MNPVQSTSWSPNRPPSKGATAYHDAVVHTSWHKNNINELINIAKKYIKTNDLVVDFGAGTGASALYLLEKIKPNFKLLLVDNSPSWLGKAYDLLNKNKQASFFILDKKERGYMTLDEVLDKNTSDHVISANTVHLIPNIEKTFKGIYENMKPGGTFIFQSGNILLSRKKGIMMIDDSINEVHDLAITIIKSDSAFAKYKKDLEKRIDMEIAQRKFVFPTPRPLDFYLDALRSVGFKNIEVTRKPIKVKYKDWMNFLRVRRLQAGILPEVGGKDATPEEELDRDTLITRAAEQLFKNLKKHNPLATPISFTAEWVYVHAIK